MIHALIVFSTIFLTIGLTFMTMTNEVYSAANTNSLSIASPTLRGQVNVDVNLLNADTDVIDENGNNIDMSNFRFRVEANVPSTPSIFEGSKGVTRESFNIFFENAGTYSILIQFVEKDDAGNEIDVTDITNDDGVIRSDGCSSTININENRACAIQIDVENIEGVDSETGEIDGFETNTEGQTVTEKTDLIPENALIEAESGVIGTTAATGVLPVDVCISQERKVNVPKDGGGFDSVDLKLAPISATYNFQGMASLDKIKKLLRADEISINPTSTDKGTQLIFEIQFDNNKGDAVKITPLDSTFKSKIYTKLFPFNNDEAGFELRKIWTECFFPSIIEAGTLYPKSEQSQSTDKKLVPLADNKASPSKSVDIPDSGEDRAFAYATRNSGILPLNEATSGALLNPPFNVCANTLGSTNIDASGNFDPKDSDKIFANKENVISKYIIRSIIDKSDLENWRDTELVLLRVTVDTVPNDHARIGDNNNNLVKVQLIIDPQQKNTEIINLELQEISTDCIDVSYSDSLVQFF